MRRLCELQTIRDGAVAGLTEWKNRSASSMADDMARSLAERTIQHFTSQLAAVNQAIAEIIDNDPDLCAKRDLLVSISGVGETLAGIVLAELPEPDVLGSSAAVAAYAGLNPQQYRSGTSINRPARISKIGNAVLRAALYMPALSAMRYNPVVAALVNRLKEQGRLKGKQIVIAAMRKLLVLSSRNAAARTNVPATIGDHVVRRRARQARPARRARREGRPRCARPDDRHRAMNGQSDRLHGECSPVSWLTMCGH